ncbi:unnamed protein product [Spirodela intermedia]|uniref:Uncharacterized protein n=1 Tax=Spirodela intermedia TaxID=51605 RepID=A0A7I8JW76_SPIIN|nr:unnamed protein product [Spirodela intermedia]
MPGNLLNAFADENPDLQRQLGCVAGIFQAFNRHRFLTSRRLTGLHHHRRPPSDLRSLFKLIHGDLFLFQEEKNHSQSLNGVNKGAASVESFRGSSSSSSCSSSLSYHDCSRPERSLPPSSSSPGQDQQDPSSSSTRRPQSFRSVVKGSIYRDGGGDPAEKNNQSSKSFHPPEIWADAGEAPRLSAGDGGPLELKDLPSAGRRSFLPPPESTPGDLQNGRAAGVVAKLMGLETMPSMRGEQALPPVFHRRRAPATAAPWREKNQSSAPHRRERHQSVYSEVESKLRDLDLRQSNRDLRALKHILESIRTKGSPETTKDGSGAAARRCEEQGGTDVSPIVIMKPAGSADRTGIPASSILPLGGISGLKVLIGGAAADGGGAAAVAAAVTAKNRSSCKSRSRESGNQLLSEGKKPSSSRPRQPRRESSGTSSPRLQQKRVDYERKSTRPPAPVGSGKPQRKSTGRHASESVSPRGKVIQQKAERMRRPTVDHSAAIGSGKKSSGEESRRRGEVNATSPLQSDAAGVSGAADHQFAELGSDFSQRGGQITPNPEEKKPLQCLEDDPSAEPGAIISPVSVLDAPFHRDDHQLPSPVNRSINPFRGGERSAAIQKKFESVENLLQKLRKLGCDGDGDHLASLCEKRTPDQRYVSEVLLASGLLLKDLAGGGGGGAAAAPPTVQLHPSGFPVNPDLFLVLEQRRSGFLPAQGRSKPDLEKIRRRLLFDAINEVLLQKVDPPPPPPLRRRILAGRTIAGGVPPGKRLLRELCSEIERLEAYGGCAAAGVEAILREDAARQWRWWLAAGEELPAVVLDIERSIFKNLVGEVIAGESFPPANPTLRRRRRLFSH